MPTMASGVFFEVGCEVLEPNGSSNVTSTFASSSSIEVILPAARLNLKGRTIHFDIFEAVACEVQ